MFLLLKNEELNLEEIRLKNNLKILYNYYSIQLLGIPLLLKNFNYDIIENMIKIKLNDKDNIINLQNIEDFFNKRFKNFKNILEENNIIYIKNITNKLILQNEIYININSLKKKDNIFYLNIYTL